MIVLDIPAELKLEIISSTVWPLSFSLWLGNQAIIFLIRWDWFPIIWTALRTIAFWGFGWWCEVDFFGRRVLEFVSAGWSLVGMGRYALCKNWEGFIGRGHKFGLIGQDWYWWRRSTRLVSSRDWFWNCHLVWCWGLYSLYLSTYRWASNTHYLIRFFIV